MTSTDSGSNEVDQVFLHYRSVMLSFSGTVIVLSSAIIGWFGQNMLCGAGLCLRAVYVLGGLIPLAGATLTAVQIQFLVFRGYYQYANWMILHKAADRGDKDFTVADRWMSPCFLCFAVGFIITTLVIIVRSLRLDQ